MPFLLRVELPDVPGSLGRVATAIGEAGGDIDAIEIVEHRGDGYAVDDVLLELAPGHMPDSIVSACNTLDGVQVIWISRYAAGGNLFMDLEAVEELTANPTQALDRLVDLVPLTFRADWAVRVRPAGPGAEPGSAGHVVHATGAAPDAVAWPGLDRAARLPDGEGDVVQCGAPLEVTGGEPPEAVVIGRRGGPDFLDSELARLGHLVALAVSISRS
jgi:hypothetical protein